VMNTRATKAGLASICAVFALVAVYHCETIPVTEDLKMESSEASSMMSKEAVWDMLHTDTAKQTPEEPWEEKDTVSAVMPPVPEPAKMAGSNTLEAIETSAPAATMTMPPVEPEMVLAMPPAPKAKFSKPPKNLKVDTDQEKPTVATASFPEPTVVADVGMVEIKTPALKSRKRRKLTLHNGMKVLIVSDPDLPASAAGLANKDGSWQNPDDALGLAHFNEHMVFMGTKKYPKPSSFDTFLTENGAQSSNAATGSAVTQYAFSVDHEAFPEALDRFGDMFAQPLMTNEGLKKEIHAVNQEYEMHKDDDGWRSLFVDKAVSNQKHPYSRFSIGTLKTLGKVDHKKIKAFYEKYYSANLMSAMIYTVLPLDEATKLVNEKFGQIPNRHLKETHINMNLLDTKMEKKAVWQKTIKTSYGITLKWELPEELSQHHHENTRAAVGRLVGHVLNYQGENSLFTELRDQKLAHSMSAGDTDKGFDASLFEIDVSLTPKGHKQWHKVVGLIFEALAKLKKEGVPERIFDTVKTNDLIGWQWQWRTSDVFNAAMDGASNLAHTLNFAEYPWAGDIIQDYKKDKINALLAVLKPDTMHVHLKAPEFPEELKDAKVNEEPYYHTQWKIGDIDQKLIEEWKGAKPAEFLTIPAANKYLAKKLAVTPKEEMEATPPVYPAIPQPTLLKQLSSDSSRVHIWEDKMFGDPYVSGSITVKTDKDIIEKQGVDALTHSTLLMTCLNHAINAKMTPFDEAGLSWGLDTGKGTNLEISFSGTNTEPEHYTALLETLAGYLKQLHDGKLGELVDKETFEMLRTSTLHSLKNALKSSPSSMAFQKLSNVMHKMGYTVPQQIQAVQKATFDQVNGMAAQMFKKTFYQGFFSGQVKSKDVETAWAAMMAKLPKSEAALDKKQFLADTMLQLPEQKQMLHTQGSAHGNCAVLVLDAGGLGCKEREALSILYQAVPTRFYNDLRSKQQTGYLVQTDTQVMVSHHNIATFVVQSDNYKPGDLFGRYDKFIDEMLVDLASPKPDTLSEKKFEMIKAAKLQTYKTPNNNIGSMKGLMETLLQNYNGDFTTMQKKQEITKDLTYQTVLDVAKKVFKGNNKQLAVAYTHQDDKLDSDKMPKEFIPFDAKTGKFVSKTEFKCPVKMDLPKKRSAEDAASRTPSSSGKSSQAGDVQTDGVAEDTTKKIAGH